MSPSSLSLLRVKKGVLFQLLSCHRHEAKFALRGTICFVCFFYYDEHVVQKKFFFLCYIFKEIVARNVSSYMISTHLNVSCASLAICVQLFFLKKFKLNILFFTKNLITLFFVNNLG